jgi:acyl-homoserine lactone acylase PvdQ
VPVAPAAAEALTETSRGSNNWVISGAHTATGRPLLANDPHLGLGVPSIWAAVHLTAPDLDVAGVVLPGTPGVTLGRNRRIAWGCTNVHDDGADLYVEEFDPHDVDRYRTPEGWERVQTRRRRSACAPACCPPPGATSSTSCARRATARWWPSARASTRCAGRRSTTRWS